MTRFDFSIIRTLRTKWGLTAEELAKRSGLTRATVSKIESGDANPTIETIGALSGVFHLSLSEFIRLTEGTQCEAAETSTFRTETFEGVHIWFPDFEIYQVRAGSGVRKQSDPRRHENTAEVCLALSGRISLTVAGTPHELGPGMALRFKALQEHHVDIIEDAEFLLIHHHRG